MRHWVPAPRPSVKVAALAVLAGCPLAGGVATITIDSLPVSADETIDICFGNVG